MLINYEWLRHRQACTDGLFAFFKAFGTERKLDTSNEADVRLLYKALHKRCGARHAKCYLVNLTVAIVMEGRVNFGNCEGYGHIVLCPLAQKLYDYLQETGRLHFDAGRSGDPVYSLHISMIRLSIAKVQRALVEVSRAAVERQLILAA